MGAHDLAQSAEPRLTPRVDLFVDAYAEALETLSAQAAEHPEFADVQNRLGLLFYLAGEPDRAVDHHQRALAINSEYVAAASSLGYALERTGDPERAHAHWQAVLDRAPRGGRRPDHPGVALDLAMALGRRGESERGLRLLVRHEKGHEEGRHRHLFARERFLLLALAGREEAREVLDRLIGASSHFKAYFAEFHLAGGEELNRPAVERLMQERDPNYNLADIYTYLGLTFAACGELAKAERELGSALAAGFDLASYHAQRGQLWSLAGDDERSAVEFAAAIAADPANVQARIELGSDLARCGRVEEAIAQFEEAGRLEPNYADVQYQLGLLYLEAERSEDAERCLARALKTNPGFALARASLALLCARNGRDDEGLQHYERALRAGLRSADIYLSIALIHLRKGDPKKAAKALEVGAKVNPRYAPIHYHLGRLYQQRGQKGRAYAAWREFFHAAEETQLTERLESFRGELGRAGRFAPVVQGTRGQEKRAQGKRG